MNPTPTIDVMRTAAQTLRMGDVRDSWRALQAVQDAADAAKAVLLAELQTSGDHEIDGASTINSWVRTQLRLNAGTATALVKNVSALRELPLVAEAATAGRISAAHVQVFRYGLAHVGVAEMHAFEDVFLAVALESEPAELFEAVKHLKDKVHPEELDDAWEKGMDKEDLQVNAVPDGFHVSGFLSTVTGLKLKKVLDSVSAPRDAEDTRTGSQRRVQGLDDLLSAILASGLPSDQSSRPHMSVFVDAETLQAAAEHVRDTTENPHHEPDPMPPTEPATLAGHGNIGPNLLMYFLCVSDFTAYLMKTNGDAQAQILNAGRTSYQPTKTQRGAVLARQKGVCPTWPSWRPQAERSEARRLAEPAATKSLERRAQRVVRPTTRFTEASCTSPGTPPTDSSLRTGPAASSTDEEPTHTEPPHHPGPAAHRHARHRAVDDGPPVCPIVPTVRPWTGSAQPCSTTGDPWLPPWRRSPCSPASRRCNPPTPAARWWWPHATSSPVTC